MTLIYQKIETEDFALMNKYHFNQSFGIGENFIFNYDKGYLDLFFMENLE